MRAKVTDHEPHAEARRRNYHFDVEPCCATGGRPLRGWLFSVYTRGDFATAMRIMRPLAEQGHATAQTVVGLMHYWGLRKRTHVVQPGGGTGPRFRGNVSKRYRR